MWVNPRSTRTADLYTCGAALVLEDDDYLTAFEHAVRDLEPLPPAPATFAHQLRVRAPTAPPAEPAAQSPKHEPEQSTQVDSEASNDRRPLAEARVPAMIDWLHALGECRRPWDHRGARQFPQRHAQLTEALKAACPPVVPVDQIMRQPPFHTVFRIPRIAAAEALAFDKDDRRALTHTVLDAAEYDEDSLSRQARTIAWAIAEQRRNMPVSGQHLVITGAYFAVLLWDRIRPR